VDLNDDRKNYIYIYAGLITLFAVLVQLRGSLFYGWSLASSTVIHNHTPRDISKWSLFVGDRD
jgi:hypothetical protein